MDSNELLNRVIEIVAEFADLKVPDVTVDSRLIGERAIVKSGALVQILLELEDLCQTEFGKEFDWTSDSALSEARSFLRSVGSLTQQLETLR